MTTDWQSPEDANILASLLEAMDRVSSAIATTPTTAVMLDNHSTLSDEHREQLVECLRKARQVCQGAYFLMHLSLFGDYSVAV
jgi:hypothetical protein